MANRRPPLRTGLKAALHALNDQKTGRRGNKATLARKLGISRAAISDWGGVIPLERVPAVERVTGVPRDLLRPDFFTKPTKKPGNGGARARLA